MSRSSLQAAFGAALLVFGGRAEAQPAGCTDRSLTQEIDRAIEERRRGREEAGFRRLEALWGRCPSPRTLAQLALAEHGLGRYRSAFVHLRDALAADDPWIASREAPLRSVLSEIAMRVARVAPLCATPGATVRIDGEAVGPCPLPTPWVLAQGTATLEVSAPGHVTERRTLTVPDGAVWREAVALRPERAVTASASASASAQRSPAERAGPTGGGARRVLAWSAVGVGAALGAVAIWQGIAWAGQAEESRAAQVTQPGDLGGWARFQRDANPGGRLSAAAVCELAAGSRTADGQGAASLCAANAQAAGLAIGFGLAGAALAVTGAVLLATGRGAGEGSPASAVQLGGWWGEGAGGARLAGSF